MTNFGIVPMGVQLRALIVLISCLGLAACAASAPVPGPATAGADHRDAARGAGERPAWRVSLQGNPRLGSATARIGIVEFGNYQCLYCRDFHRQQFGRLKTEYIDTGVVRFIHMDLPLRIHPQAVPAALAARCAGAQDRFWDMHDALYANQGRLNQDLYPDLARRMNLDETRFQACFENQVPGRDIARDMVVARGLGFTGTPSFLIGIVEGDTLIVKYRARGAPEYEVFAREIEKLRNAEFGVRN